MLTLEPRFGLDSAMVLAPFLIAILVALTAGIVALRVRRPARATWAALVPRAGYVLATLLGWRTAFFDGKVAILIAVDLVIWAAWWPGYFGPRRILYWGLDV